MHYSDIKKKDFIMLDGAPYEVLDTHVFRKQQRKPVNQTKLKNLITGKVVEHSFHQSESVEEAEIERRPAKFIYHKRGEWWFQDPNDPSDRFEIAEDVIGDASRFLKEGAEVEALVFGDQIVNVSLPIKMTFEVTEAPPNVKGNTAQGGNKPVTIETGTTVTTPMFIEMGDVIEVNTESGEYTQRINK